MSSAMVALQQRQGSHLLMAARPPGLSMLRPLRPCLPASPFRDHPNFKPCCSALRVAPEAPTLAEPRPYAFRVPPAPLCSHPHTRQQQHQRPQAAMAAVAPAAGPPLLRRVSPAPTALSSAIWAAAEAGDTDTVLQLFEVEGYRSIDAR